MNRQKRYKGYYSRGVALVSVLLILAIMVTLLVYMVESQFLFVRQTNSQQLDELSVLENSHAEAWGQSVLTKFDRESYEADMLSEDWANSAFEVDDPVQKKAKLLDLQGRLNLNNLLGNKQAVWLPVFQRLLKTLDLDEAIAFAVIDWLDEDANPINADGAEDLEYFTEVIPRRTANQWFSSIEELLFVKGVNDDVYKKLFPYVYVVRSAGVKVNMNTASVEIVKSILPNGLTSGAPEQFVSSREGIDFKSVTELLESDFLAGVGETLNDLIDVKSQYFEINSTVNIADTSKKYQTGIKREILDDAVSFSIIYRKKSL